MDLSLLAQDQLRDFLSSFRLDGDPVRVRDALLQFFPDLVTTYGDVSALLASDFYDMLRDVPVSSASFRAAFAQPVDVKQSTGVARWAVGSLFDGDYELFLSQLMGATQRLVAQRGRETVFQSARRDPVATRVARVPSGLVTCRFCAMLASRGAVYDTTTGMGKFHDNCDCVPVVIRTSADYPPGYDPAYFLRLYQEGSGVGRDIPQGGTLDIS